MIKGWTFASIYALLLGFAAIILGIMEIIVFAGGTGLSLSPFLFPGDFFGAVWGGGVLASGGALIIAGARNIRSVQGFAHVLLGNLMIWTIGGCELIGRFCTALPAPEGSSGFFNSLQGFIGAFGIPYSPAVIILPFTIPVIWLFFAGGFANKR